MVGIRLGSTLVSTLVALVIGSVPAYAAPTTMTEFTASGASMICGSFRFDRGEHGLPIVDFDLDRILVSCVDLTLPDAVTRKPRAFAGLAFEGGGQFWTDGDPRFFSYSYRVTAIGAGARIAQAGGTSEGTYTSSGIAFVKGNVSGSFSGIDTTGSSENPAPAMSTALRGEPPTSPVSTFLTLAALDDGSARLERWTQVFALRVETAPTPPGVSSAALIAAAAARAFRRRRPRL